MNAASTGITARVATGTPFYSKPVMLLLVFASCILLVWLMYWPVADHYFVSDDFKVLRRVCANGQILIPGFFRPLSDLTLFVNFQFNGLDPRIFNGFNLLVHAATGTLLFYFSIGFYRSYGPEKISVSRDELLYAGAATVLFLSYPFHSEAVVWLLGRGASMATFFCLAAMFSCQASRGRLAIVAASGFFFIALLAYESALVLPFLLWLIMKKQQRPWRELMRWLIAMSVTLVAHLLLRLMLSGSVTGSYGSGFLTPAPTLLFGNIFRVIARLFLPPMVSTKQFMLAAGGIGLFAIIMLMIRRKKTLPVSSLFHSSLGLTALLVLASALVPFMTGVSIHTTESDRMLYLPSVFVCLLIAPCLKMISGNKSLRAGLFAVFVGAQVFALEKINSNWREAGAMTRGLVHNAVPQGSQSRVLFLEVKDNVQGAYVFRQGFVDALALNGKDTVYNRALFYPGSKRSWSPRDSLSGFEKQFRWESSSGQWMPLPVKSSPELKQN